MTDKVAPAVKLGPDTYHMWSSLLKGLLMSKQVWPLVPVTDQTMYDAFAQAIKDKDVKALGLIILNAGEQHAMSLGKFGWASAAWEFLEKQYAAVDVSRKLTLLRELDHFKMKSGETITDYIERAKNLQTRLGTVNEVVANERMTTLILKGLPGDYDVKVKAIATAVEITGDISKLTPDLIKPALLNEESDLADKDKQSERAFYTNPNSEHDNSYCGNNYNPQRSFNNPKSNPQAHGDSTGPGLSGDSYSNFKCHHCGIPGHVKRNCRKYLAELRSTSQPAFLAEMGLVSMHQDFIPGPDDWVRDVVDSC
jgi:hypothetical protein